MNVIDQFMPLVREREEDGVQVPIIAYDNMTFVYVQYRDLYRILTKMLVQYVLMTQLVEH